MRFAQYFRRSKHLAPKSVPEQPAPAATVRAISISMVKNEQDIIETFLRTNRPYLDAMIVMDNGSIDSTRDIALDCARELGGIFIIDSPKSDYTQANQITAAFLFAQSAFFADHVVFLDSDEFLSARSPEEFWTCLAEEADGTATLHAWRTYLPDPGGAENADPLDAIRFVRKQELPAYKKAILHLGGGFSDAIQIKKGAHGARLGPQPIPARVRHDLPLVHVPVRSADQIVAKALNGWRSLTISHPELSQVDGEYKGASAHRKRLIDQVRKKGAVLGPADLADIAMSYAQAKRSVDFQLNTDAERPKLDLTRRFSDGQAMPAELSVFKDLLGKATPDYSSMLDRPTLQNPGADQIPATAFSDKWHWSHLYVDVAPFRFLAEYLRPRSVLDVGCGKGIYLRLFEHFGSEEILGIDGVDVSTTVLTSDQYLLHDLHVPIDLGKTFDLVICLEVIEHLDPTATVVAINTIARHARERIVFSMAEPGQPGNGHINCLPMDLVLALWAERGWVPDRIDTLGLRAISTMSWFRRNLLVLRKAGPDEDCSAAAALKSIAALRYKWYGQDPGIRPVPFGEAYPTNEFAYGRVRSRNH